MSFKASNKDKDNLINNFKPITFMAQDGVYVFPGEGTGSSHGGVDPNLLLALNQNGGFGGGAGWLWPMFMFMMYPWLFGGMGFNGLGGLGGGAGLLGTGFLSNQINNQQGADLILQAIQGNANAASQLAQITNSSIERVNGVLGTISNGVTRLEGTVGLTGQQIISNILSGNADLSRQLCECCCENRLAIANQTNTLQAGQSDLRHSIDMAGAADTLAICQQTNALQSAGVSNTQRILDGLNVLHTDMTREFCNARERDMQNEINSKNEIITQLRGQISNDAQTAQLYGVIAPLQAKVNEIANKQPNTVPVAYPNLTAVNNTPCAGGFPYGYGYGYGYGGGGFWG